MSYSRLCRWNFYLLAKFPLSTCDVCCSGWRYLLNLLKSGVCGDLCSIKRHNAFNPTTTKDVRVSLIQMYISSICVKLCARLQMMYKKNNIDKMNTEY